MRSKIIIQTSALIIVGVIIGLASSAVLGFVFQQPVQQKLVLAVQPTLAAAEVLQRAKPIEAFLER
ncbi:MAG: hypothetical protein RMH74_05815, partial [Candidatus Caldarchaeum sp.]|nr:hypothetical protein [Candidatus Caldarchaeum sp.]